VASSLVVGNREGKPGRHSRLNPSKASPPSWPAPSCATSVSPPNRNDRPLPSMITGSLIRSEADARHFGFDQVAFFEVLRCGFLLGRGYERLTGEQAFRENRGRENVGRATTAEVAGWAIRC